MAYATVAEIESEFKKVSFSGSSLITSTEISDFLDQTDAIIDTKLGLRYETPITGAKSLLVMKKIEIDFVAYRVAKILEIKKNIPVPDANIVTEITEGTAFKISQDLLENLQKGLVILPDAVKTSTDGGMKSYTTTDDTNLEPVFDVEEQQW